MTVGYSNDIHAEMKTFLMSRVENRGKKASGLCRNHYFIMYFDCIAIFQLQSRIAKLPSTVRLIHVRICFMNAADISYTRVNKRIRLFPKLQGNMRLIPNMRLIMKAKLTTPPTPRRELSGVASPR